MPKRTIVVLPEKVLKKTAEEVPVRDISGARIQHLIADMRETLSHAADGVGLAAPQVGVSARVFLVSEEAQHIGRGGEQESPAKPPRAWQYAVFINPVLEKQSRQKETVFEGCLSVPGKFGEVARSEKVFLRWVDEHGKKHARGFAGFFARVIQHELDHLNGFLISDRAKKLVSIAKADSGAT